MAPIIPQNTNPYSTPTENSEYTSQSNSEKSHHLFRAAALGLGCSLIGPGFLAIYYARHGSQMSVLDSSLFFGLVYILPSLLTLGAAFPLGLLVSHKIPTFKKPACQLVDPYRIHWRHVLKKNWIVSNNVVIHPPFKWYFSCNSLTMLGMPFSFK